MNEINTFLNYLTQHEDLSCLYLDVRSFRLNLDDFRTLLEEDKHTFNSISLTETWIKDHEFKTNSKHHFQRYEGSHFERKTNKRGRVVFIYIVNDFTYKIRKDLCISDGDREMSQVNQ